MQSPADNLRPPDDEIAEATRAAIAATERGDYEGALRVFGVLYSAGSPPPPMLALSYYGLCLALQENQTKKGIELCREALEHQFYEPAHYANLIQLYLKKRSRRKAVQVLEEAMEKIPDDPTILRVRQEMGYRSDPPIRFLHRDNPLNMALGKTRRKSRARVAPSRKEAPDLAIILESPLVKIAAAVIFFALLFGLTYYFFHQSAYG